MFIVAGAVATGLAVACTVHTTIEVEAISPDGQHVATLARVNGGAMSSMTTLVSIRKSGDSFSRSWGSVFVANRGYPIELVWRDASTLEVVCRMCESSGIERQQKHWNAIKVSYPHLGAAVQHP